MPLLTCQQLPGGRATTYFDSPLEIRNSKLSALSAPYDESVPTHHPAVRRFRREAQAAARLDHPNIVRLFDSDHSGDTHYLAMEYVNGVTLDRLVEQHGPVPFELACDFIRQAALGLQHAHERGLVHRD